MFFVGSVLEAQEDQIAARGRSIEDRVCSTVLARHAVPVADSQYISSPAKLEVPF